MTKSWNFPCKETWKLPQNPNFKITQDNPLRIFQLNQETAWQVIRVLDKENKAALKRLTSQQFLTKGFQIIHWANIQVINDRFRDDFNKVFRNRTNPILKNTSEPIHRSHKSTGTLEIYWPSTSRVLTKHHIIPRSRGGMNHEKNYFWMPRDVHDDFHDVFDTLTPIEQLAYMMLLFKPSYHPSFVRDMADLLLSNPQNNHYKNGTLRNHRVEY